MSTILSTKKLSLSQKQLLLNSGLGLVEYNAIEINFSPFSSELNPGDNVILTSKNAVTALLKNNTTAKVSGVNIFCVGEKTAGLLEDVGLKVLECKPYGADLAEVIINNYTDHSFIYFCGNIRRDELPNILNDHQVKYKEIEVYSTSLNKKTFVQQFDAICFYSPSGVKSYFSVNEPGTETAICIGKTTASEAEKYSKKIITATKPSVENVIVQAVKLLGKSALGKA